MKQSCGRRWFLAVVASGALAWSGAAAAQVETSGVVQLEQFVARTRQAAGSFEQTVTASSGRRPQISSGTFVFMRPGKFRWVYERPYPQLLVSDGERLWSWDEDLNQVTTRVLGDALGSTPAAVLTGDGALVRGFELADAEPADGPRSRPTDCNGSLQRRARRTAASNRCAWVSRKACCTRWRCATTSAR